MIAYDTKNIVIIIIIVTQNFSSHVSTLSHIHTMQYSLLVGYTIAVLDVTDADEGTNSFLTYEVISPVRTPQQLHKQ